MPDGEKDAHGSGANLSVAALATLAGTAASGADLEEETAMIDKRPKTPVCRWRRSPLLSHGRGVSPGRTVRCTTIYPRDWTAVDMAGRWSSRLTYGTVQNQILLTIPRHFSSVAERSTLRAGVPADGAGISADLMDKIRACGGCRDGRAGRATTATQMTASVAFANA